MRTFIHIVGVVLLGLVTGCAATGKLAGHSNQAGDDATGVRVHYSFFSSESDIANEATLHCQRFGKVAQKAVCDKSLTAFCDFWCVGEQSKSNSTAAWKTPSDNTQVGGIQSKSGWTADSKMPPDIPQVHDPILASTDDVSDEQRICGDENAEMRKCSEQLEIAKRQMELEAQRYQLELQRYQLEKARYDAYLAEVEKEKARRSGEWLMKFGAALAGGTSGNFGTDVANAGYVAAGLPPLQPPTPPSPPVIHNFKLRVGDGYTEANCSYNTLNNTVSCR
jgi:hypothetical protein